MAIKKYCIYFPYRLDINQFEQIKDYDQVYTSIKQYLLFDDNLDTTLTTIKRFIRFNQESELSLLKKNNKIYAVIFSRDGYKPFNILPVINDMDNMQCFIALSTNWITLDELTLYGKTYDDNVNILLNNDIDTIQNLYNLNKNTLIPLIEQAIERLFQQYFSNKNIFID